jgi:6-phosphogluconolactonase
MAGLVSMAGAMTATAKTFVYVSNADDGDVSTYTMQADGALQPGPRVKVAATVMPMS